MSSRNRCGLLRRLAAIFYDAIVLIAILFGATLPVVLALHGAPVVIEDRVIVSGSSWFAAYEILVAFAFYGGFWTHGGQTIGMRTWGVRLVRRDGSPVRWRDAVIRFAGAMVSWAAAGAGFWWCLIDSEGLAWHDRWSATELRRVPRAAEGSE